MTLPRAGEFAYLSISEMPTSMVRDVVQVAEVVPVAVHTRSPGAPARVAGCPLPTSRQRAGLIPGLTSMSTDCHFQPGRLPC